MATLSHPMQRFGMPVAMRSWEAEMLVFFRYSSDVVWGEVPEQLARAVDFIGAARGRRKTRTLPT